GGGVVSTRGLERVPIQLGTARVSSGVLQAWPMAAGKSAAIDLLPPPPPPPPPVPRPAVAAAVATAAALPVKPSAARPTSGGPIAASPVAARPTAPRPVTVKLLAAKPSVAKPIVAKPVMAKPEAARSGVVKRDGAPTVPPHALSDHRGRENDASEGSERRPAKSARASPPAPQTATPAAFDRARVGGGRGEGAATFP
ncbi:unnamed protein product, partial [Laminaria digitata]